MTWSSDGNCLAGVREQSKGKVTLTHIKKGSRIQRPKVCEIYVYKIIDFTITF